MTTDFALLLLRLVVGGLMVGHGTQKLFGWFGGYGFSGTAAFFGSMLRLRPAGLWVAAAGLSEAGGGLLLTLGFLGPLGALGIVAAMTMATALAHWPKLWVSENGFEYPLVVAVVATAVGLIGPGNLSLDAVLGIQVTEPTGFLAGLVPVIAGSLVALLTRVPAAAVGEQETAGIRREAV